MDVIDTAVLSRVTVVLNYPNLTQEVRSVIWQQNLRLADIRIDTLDALVKLDLSGRDIRNYVKLIHYIFDHEVTESQVLALIQNHHK
ncbi:MAG: hypothetical protein JJU02_09455 [Cryomorphaceae bacterium]|nr:hypothetical protein [Cryomorphaceae bacterium]